jgi:2-polyprenyl-3-methyl-5-hydroxy-6-metoxy-1,4-benzoquinol methylase
MPDTASASPISVGSVSIVDQYAAEVAAFNARLEQMGVADIGRYYWYHTIDLPGGIATPGMYDYRATLGAFQLPERMDGLTVLDVGSASGFWTFEFERRGAQVTSVDLPSLEMLDRFPGQETSALLKTIQHMIVPHSEDRLEGLVRDHSAAELHHYLLDAPFRLCARLLGSRVVRRYSTIYDLSPESLGRPSFDLVFLGDILVHTLRPFDALVAAAKLCRGTLIVAQEMPGTADDAPAMIYRGGEKLGEDDICWWLPNEACFKQLLKKLGFAEVEAVGDNDGLLRPAGHPFSRRILHARRSAV